MLQQEEAEDHVIATRITTTVREFVRSPFAETEIELEFKGTGIDEKVVPLPQGISGLQKLNY